MKKIMALIGIFGCSVNASSYVLSCGESNSNNDGIGGYEEVNSDNLDEMIELHLKKEQEEYPALQEKFDQEKEFKFGKNWWPDTIEKRNELQNFKKNNKTFQDKIKLYADMYVLEYKICQVENGLQKFLDKHGLQESDKDLVSTTKEKLLINIKNFMKENEKTTSNEVKLYFDAIINKYF
ncbi:hypothetical protein SLITO_v1c08490 [Spiroplasma litorale]|uniref:Uncharacterized protein n=1 Tax=Spiroplasma litorale TaxID=216942 RepID=A0A0K1W2A8_9MOLU|nr:hypothetical protein [Spiroplasma litorale]AKX34464.1 hypothetical protein SLITO_v1c08490 [Spiroplasma litorale]